VDWTYINQHGIEVPYEDRRRRVKTYWEILSERGIPTGTLNWWVSHPPAQVQVGYVVSNAFPRGAEAGSVYPRELFASLDPLRVRNEDAEAEQSRQGIPAWRKEDASIPMDAWRHLLRAYPSYVAADVTVDRASDWLWENRPVRAFSTYFRLVDVTSHFATHFMNAQLYQETVAKRDAGVATEQDIARLDRDFARVVEPAYAFMDRIVGKYLERLDGKTLLIVCSDHGFSFFGARYNHANPAMRVPDGVLFLAGPGVRRGHRIRDADLYDIAPTILEWTASRCAAPSSPRSRAGP
jgi:predicted AlkP superfamily phosphohydrolase/phosphomutase